MTKSRSPDTYGTARTKLLDSGQELIRANSFNAVGLKEILDACQVPKGSFYHYFDSKEAFGIAIAQHYHAAELARARGYFGDVSKPPKDRLLAYFQDAYAQMEQRGFSGGCLMCNLSTELGRDQDALRAELATHWEALVAEIAGCLTQMELAELGLGHLPPEAAADWLLNSWSGALTRMKATRSGAPLALFLRTVFNV